MWIYSISVEETAAAVLHMVAAMTLRERLYLMLLRGVHESGFMMPVIVDYSLVKDNVDQPWNFRYCTNMERLAALLCCSNYAELAIDKIDPSQYENPLCVNWYDDGNGGRSSLIPE